MIPCQAKGHGHVGAADSSTGFGLPFCAPHVDALPVRLRRPLLELAEESVYEVHLHAQARDLIAKGRAFLAKLKGPVRGICRHCGCTDDHGCDAGCSWVDRQRTLCSACSERSP